MACYNMTKYFAKWRKGAKKGKNGKYYMPSKRKATVRKAVKKVQQKTELKDRINIVRSHSLTTPTGS